MSLHVYSIMWNEEFLLPYFLKHYEKVADKIFIIDDHSTDKTAKIAKAHPKVVYSQYAFDGLNETEFSGTLESFYKSNPSDWAVCVDGDEFIHGLDKGLEVYGDSSDKHMVWQTKGYMMVGETGRLEDCRKVRMKSFDKPVVFDASLDIRFGDGRHTVNLPYRESKDSNLELWHYKYISREHYLQRALDSYPRIMNSRDMGYRIKRGLRWYDEHVQRGA